MMQKTQVVNSVDLNGQMRIACSTFTQRMWRANDSMVDHFTTMLACGCILPLMIYENILYTSDFRWALSMVTMLPCGTSLTFVQPLICSEKSLCDDFGMITILISRLSREHKVMASKVSFVEAHIWNTLFSLRDNWSSSYIFRRDTRLERHDRTNLRQSKSYGLVSCSGLMPSPIAWECPTFLSLRSADVTVDWHQIVAAPEPTPAETR